MVQTNEENNNTPIVLAILSVSTNMAFAQTAPYLTHNAVMWVLIVRQICVTSI